MEPAAGEGLVGRRLVLEIALHHDIAAEHHLAHRLAVGRHGLHRFGVEHVERLERVIAHALARLEMRLGLCVERVPLLLPVVDDGRAVDLGQPVEMRDLEACLAHRLEDRRGRRRGGGEEAHADAAAASSPQARALSSTDMTIGAPQRWVTLCSAMRS